MITRMFSCPLGQAVLLAFFLSATWSRADQWNSWGHASFPGQQFSGGGSQLATDGTNMYFSTALNGICQAALGDQIFFPLPMTGFPLWDANTNTNGFAVVDLAVTPQGRVVISGSQVSVTSSNITFNPPGSSANTLPVFYWWDETNQLWQAAVITGKTYPYTGNVGNFSIAPDGSLWTCSGFASYAYRSTNGGMSYTAFDINARVPANYLPIPLAPNLTSFGEIFSIAAGWNNEVVIGTETGGYLYTTNNGTTWASLDLNFTNTNSTHPLGRIGDARVAGIDHYGNFLCANFQMIQSPASTNWSAVKLIGWRPGDGSVFNAANGLPAGFGVTKVLTRSSGLTYTFMNQGSNNLGGVYRALDGKNWSPFNNGLTAVSGNVGNALASGNCITVFSNVYYIGIGNYIYSFDSTPPPVTRRPPVARPQSVNLFENSPTNFTLAGCDADGNALNYTVTSLPTNGILSGTPPDLTYTPSNNFARTDLMFFVVDDGVTTSAPAPVNFSVNATINPPPAVNFTSPVNRTWLVAPANLVLAVAASASSGISQVNFCNGSNVLGVVPNPPYTFTWSNPPPGDYTLNAIAVSKAETRTWAKPVTVSVLPVRPKLSIAPADASNIAVTWSLALDGFFIESAPDAGGPWTLSPYPQFFFTNGQTATIPEAGGQLFRLMRPQ